MQVNRTRMRQITQIKTDYSSSVKKGLILQQLTNELKPGYMTQIAHPR